MSNAKAPSRKLGNWIKSYADYTAPSESPDAYHLWVALTVLSTATRRNIWLDMGLFSVYPNLYVLLVSPPGTCRKGGAMSLGRYFLDRIPEVYVEANKVTPQALIESLSNTTPSVTVKGKTGISLQQKSCASIYSTEFSVTLGADANQTGMLALLTDLYDCPAEWKYKTRGRGEEKLYNVFLTILGATTPKWLSTSIPPDAIGGGFTSRIIFVAQHKRRHSKAIPTVSPALRKLRDDLLHDLLIICKISGEMTLSDEAFKFYNDWYDSRGEPQDSHLDERFWGYIERKPVHLLKVAMLLAIAESDDPVISIDQLGRALDFIDLVEKRMPDAFAAIGGDQIIHTNRILDHLLSGPKSYSDILRHCYRYAMSFEIDRVLETLTKAGVIIEDVEKNIRMFRMGKKISPNGGGDGQ